MSCHACNSTQCVCTQCPEACPELIEQSAQNLNLLGIGVYDSESDGVFQFRGIRAGDSSITVALNAGQGTIDITNNAFDDNPTQTFTNAAARAAAAPAFIGQLAIQVDTLIAYTGTGLAAGNWALTISNGQPLDADLTAIAALATTGLLVQTAAATYTTRTITGDASLQVTDGDGVAGDPTLTVLEAGLDKNTIGGAVLTVVNGGTGTSTGSPATFGTAITSEPDDYVIVPATDSTVFIVAGNYTIVLPSPVTYSGRIFTVKRTASGGTTTVAPVSGSVEAGPNVTLTGLQGAKFQSDGTNWWILSKRA